MVIICLILLSGTLIEYMQLVIAKGLPFGLLLYMLVLTLPATLAIAFPIGFLMAVLVAFSRMGADTELLALRTLGWPVRRLFLPVLYTAVLVGGATFALTAYVMPRANHHLAVQLIETRARRSFAGLQPRVFFTQIPEAILYVHQLDPTRTRWRSVLFIDQRDPDIQRIVLARRARVHDLPGRVPRVEIRFFEGTVYAYHLENPERYRVAEFSEYRTRIALGIEIRPETMPKGDREMTLGELRAVLRTRPPGDLYRQGALVEYHKRWAFPMACLVFAVTGFAMSVRHPRGGRFYGYMVSIAIMLVAYAGILVGEHLGDQGRIPAWLAAWNPHVLLGIPGLWLFYRLDRPFRRPPLWWARLQMRWREWWNRVLAWIAGERAALDYRFWTPGMTLVDRYILRHWIRFFAVASIATLGVYLIVEAFHLLDDMVRSQAPLRDLMRYLAFAAPGFYHQLLPMILIMSIMVTVAVLEKFREITAMKAHGISYYRVMAPMFAAALVVTGVDYGLQERVLPWTQEMATVYKSRVKGRPLYSTFHVQWIFGETGYLYHFDAYDVQRDRFYGFDIFGVDPDAWRINWHCHAWEAYYTRTTGWRLVLGWCKTMRESLQFRTFRLAAARLPETPDYFETTRKSSDQMSIAELRRYIRELQYKQYPTRSWETDLAMKWLWPLANLVLFPLALALALQGAHLGTAYGLVVAILIGFMHWLLTQLTHVLGMVEALPPWVAAAVPVVFTLLIGLGWMTRVRT